MEKYVLRMLDMGVYKTLDDAADVLKDLLSLTTRKTVKDCKMRLQVKQILNSYDMGFHGTLSDMVSEFMLIVNLTDKKNLNYKECEELFLSYCYMLGRHGLK